LTHKIFKSFIIIAWRSTLCYSQKKEKEVMQMKKFFVLLFIVLVGLLFISASQSAGGEAMGDIRELDLGVKTQDIRFKGSVTPDLNFGKFPLYFIANKGQVNQKAKFYAKASRYTLWLTGEGLIFDSVKKVKVEASPKFQRDVSRLVFLNAKKNPGIVPVEESKLKVNYFIGNDPSKWQCDGFCTKNFIKISI